MAWRRRLSVLAVAAIVATAAVTIGNPDPPKSQANVACDVGVGAAAPVTVVTGAVGIGNPVGDACDAVADPVLGAAGDVVTGPIKDAAESIGKGVFNQITSWATDGAVWLLGEVVELTEATTSPHLLSAGFLRQYKQMASIAVVLALAMLIFAVLEGLGRGDAGMLWRVFLVNVPVAALATSAAYVVVQLLVTVTDGFCEVITQTTGEDSREFFKGAIEGLTKAGAVSGTVTPGQGSVGGAVAVPLFVGFIAAILAAFAAFAVWIELLMRSAAIYAVALFMPLALAASIWPRWTSALRRTGELIVVVVFSKFVIVAIIALAASLAAKAEGVEAVLTAGALLLLACFSPFVLFKLVPFAESAVGAAVTRQSAGGGASRAVQTVSSVQMMRRAASANWAGGPKGAGSAGGSGGKAGGASKGAGGAEKFAAGGGAEASAAGSAAGVAALPVTAAIGTAKAAKGAGERLGASDTAAAVPDGGSARPAAEDGGLKKDSGARKSEAPASGRAPAGGGSEPPPAGARSSSTRPAPSEATGGAAPGGEQKAPRPSGDSGVPSKPAPGGKAKP